MVKQHNILRFPLSFPFSLVFVNVCLFVLVWPLSLRGCERKMCFAVDDVVPRAQLSAAGRSVAGYRWWPHTGWEGGGVTGSSVRIFNTTTLHSFEPWTYLGREGLLFNTQSFGWRRLGTHLCCCCCFYCRLAIRFENSGSGGQSLNVEGVEYEHVMVIFGQRDDVPLGGDFETAAA